MLKYVRLQHPAKGLAFAFGLAPLSHADLAGALKSDGWRPMSAGFTHFGPACGVTVHGYSESLDLGTDPHDAALIAALYKHTEPFPPPLTLMKDRCTDCPHAPATA